MTTISAKVILSSKTNHSPTLYTILGRYPRWIHAEGRTHRQLLITEDLSEDMLEPRTPSIMEERGLSRNASSSRAIPVAKLIADMRADPAVPLFWGANQKGMQAGDECTEKLINRNRPFRTHWSREEAWLDAMEQAAQWATIYDEAGYHKQIVNRLLEPFTHINVLLTGTEWSNFLALRDHDMAEPHICLFAQEVKKAMAAAEPQHLEPGQWHLPFIRPEEYGLYNTTTLRNVSVARCARLSYMTHEGKEPDVAADLALYKRLAGSIPMHASPLEHQATPDKVSSFLQEKYKTTPYYYTPSKHGNLVGWIQGRKTVQGECQ